MSPNDKRGVLSIIAAMTLFSVTDAIMKYALELVPAGQLLFVRGIILTAGCAIFAWRAGAFARARDLLEPHTVARGALEAIAAFSFIAALAHIPLALNTAINMATPLFVLPVAVLLLGERFGVRRVAAILVGFLGVLLILRPGTEGFDVWLAVSFLSAVMCAVRDVVTRRIPQHVPSPLVTLVTLAAVCAFSGAVAFLQGFVPMPGIAWLCVFASAVFAGTGMHFMVLSMRLGQVSIVAPFRYSGLISSMLLGWIFWGYLPDGTAWIGMALIVAAGIYALWRERKVRG
jgi:drug/metabolite transporter (DMT)-like permease